jgi:hypothetical protein
MKARAFEQRHPMLLRLCIYAAAFGTYVIDRDDVVWRFIRDLPARRPLEHGAFLDAALLIGMGAYLCTRGNACAHSHKTGLAGEWLYAIGLSTLAPLWGSVVLVAGESLRILRLDLAHPQSAQGQRASKLPNLRRALRRQATKWGVHLTMVVFSITLVDRVADYGIIASIALGAALNRDEIFRRGA